MTTVTIEFLNHSFMRVSSDEGGVEQEISEFFTFIFPGYEFAPKYRAGLWDGKIRLYDSRNKQLRVGLLEVLIQFLQSNNYEMNKIGFPGLNNSFTNEDCESHIEKLNFHSNNIPLEFRDYQYDSITDWLNKSRGLVKSATGSGKSAIIYAITRWFVDQDMRVLIVTPSTMLVDQTYSDQEDYSSHNGFDVAANAQKVYGGQSKDITKNIVISVWNSIYKLNSKFFNTFDCVIVDEAHRATGTSLQTLLDKCTDVKYRIGFTGTIDKKAINKLTLIGMFGTIYEANSTQELIGKGMLTPLKINALVLKHDDESKKLLNKCSYVEEINFLISSQRRNKLITNLAVNTNGNTMILFRYVEKHGDILYKMIKDKTDRPVYYIHGGIKQSERERIRKEINTIKNGIIIGSDQIMSTGINIPSLDNIIFASPTKSMYKVLQSIGRVLRLMHGKEYATLYDIADDISYKKSRNITLNHFLERLKIYSTENFSYKIIDIDLY